MLRFPVWWHGPPSILKGWLDRGFVYGGRYTSRMRYDTGYYRGRHALLSVTTGVPVTVFGPGSCGGDLGVLHHPLHYSLHYLGYMVLPPFAAHGVQAGGVTHQSEGRFHALLEDHKVAWSHRLEHLDHDTPLVFPGWDDWDETGAALARTPIDGEAAARLHPTEEGILDGHAAERSHGPGDREQRGHRCGHRLPARR